MVQTKDVLEEASTEALPDILKVVQNAESQVAQSMPRHGLGIDNAMKEEKTQNFKKGLHAAIIEMKSRTAVQLLLVQVCFLSND